MNINEGKVIVVIFYFQTLYMSNNSVKDMSEFGKLVSLIIIFNLLSGLTLAQNLL